MRYYLTINVLDRRGVIRHVDLHGEELEKAVNAPLAKERRRSFMQEIIMKTACRSEMLVSPAISGSS